MNNQVLNQLKFKEKKISFFIVNNTSLIHLQRVRQIRLKRRRYVLTFKKGRTIEIVGIDLIL